MDRVRIWVLVCLVYSVLSHWSSQLTCQVTLSVSVSLSLKMDRLYIPCRVFWQSHQDTREISNTIPLAASTAVMGAICHSKLVSYCWSWSCALHFLISSSLSQATWWWGKGLVGQTKKHNEEEQTRQRVGTVSSDSPKYNDGQVANQERDPQGGFCHVCRGMAVKHK